MAKILLEANARLFVGEWPGDLDAAKAWARGSGFSADEVRISRFVRTVKHKGEAFDLDMLGVFLKKPVAVECAEVSSAEELNKRLGDFNYGEH